MTEAESSLLLYLETRAVDYCGCVDPRYMSAHDFEIAEQWNDDGFIQFGRIKAESITERFKRYGVRETHFVVLSDAAWAQVATERRARALRTLERATYVSEGKPFPSVKELRKGIGMKYRKKPVVIEAETYEPIIPEGEKK